MLQNTSKTLGSKKSMVYKNTPGGGGKPYLAYEYQNKKAHLTPFLFGAPKCSKISIFHSVL